MLFALCVVTSWLQVSRNCGRNQWDSTSAANMQFILQRSCLLCTIKLPFNIQGLCSVLHSICSWKMKVEKILDSFVVKTLRSSEWVKTLEKLLHFFLLKLSLAPACLTVRALFSYLKWIFGSEFWSAKIY